MIYFLVIGKLSYEAFYNFSASLVSEIDMKFFKNIQIHHKMQEFIHTNCVQIYHIWTILT